MTTFVDQEKPPLSELAHHGVKGMHWGVRKTDEFASTESRSDRKQSADAVRDYMWEAVKNEAFSETMTRSEYEALSTKGEEFTKGLMLMRVSNMDRNTLDSGTLYVSKTMADHEFYKASLPAMGPAVKGLGGGGQKKYKSPSYEVTLQTTQKLKLPSDKERVDAFTEILGTPSIKVPGKNAPITGRQYLETMGYKRLFKNKSDQEAAFLAYHDFLNGQGEQGSVLNKAYFDNLRAKGYNAVVDNNDQKRFTEKPLIILDAKNNVKSTSIRRLTADEINQAQRNLIGKTSPGAKRAIEEARQREIAKAQKKGR